MRVDYVALLQAEMVRMLPTRSRREKDAFAALEVQEQAWRFMNWQSRLVHPHARQVNKAEGFDDLPAVQANKADVDSLLTCLARGDNVSAHLSQKVDYGYCLHPQGRKDGPDFDLLLNEWGVHHLHLGQASGRSGSRVTSRDLLYVILGRGVAFALSVASHGIWTSRQLIEITVRSWPHQRLFIPLIGVLPGRDWSEDQHKGLRKVGMTTAAVVNEQCWLSGVTCGMSTALVSNRVSREAGRLLICVYNLAEKPEYLEHQLKSAAALNGISWPTEPSIAIRWCRGPNRYCFGFVEETTGVTTLIDTS